MIEMLKGLTTIQTLVGIKYQLQQESFSRLCAQEAQIRNSLSQLNLHLAASRNSEDGRLQAIGADVVWQAWIGRKKCEMNLQLAQILAVKERHVAQVRTAYGKVLVADSLVHTVKNQQMEKKSKTNLDNAINSILFRPR